MLENTGVFRHSLCLCTGFPLLQTGLRNLKNTVWKTPFGTLGMNVGHSVLYLTSPKFRQGPQSVPAQGQHLQLKQTHLAQHVCYVCVVALLSVTVEKGT